MVLFATFQLKKFFIQKQESCFCFRTMHPALLRINNLQVVTIIYRVIGCWRKEQLERFKLTLFLIYLFQLWHLVVIIVMLIRERNAADTSEPIHINILFTDTSDCSLTAFYECMIWYRYRFMLKLHPVSMLYH